MTRQISFTHLEQAITPGFRERMDRAENTEDVRKFFAEVASTFLSDAMGQPGAVRYEDVTLAPDAPDGYKLADTLASKPGFLDVWEGSDLSRIMASLARSATNRFVHLDKNPLRTEAKMFHHKQGKTQSR